MAQPSLFDSTITGTPASLGSNTNYTLYGDMSARTNAVFRQFAKDVEIYSIDESFLG
jgi:hypothetical protein